MGLSSVRCGACLGFAVACGAVPRPARAWEATQVTLQATALSYQQSTLKTDLGYSRSASVTSLGFFGSGVGAGVGYAWDRVLFGVRANVQTVPSGSDSAATLSLFPRLEYQTDPGQSGPFIAGLLGVTHTSVAPGTVTAFGFGGSLGVHAFIAPAVSLDPELTVLGTAGSGKLSGESASQTGVQVFLTLGLSGWLSGTHSSRLPPAAVETPQAPPLAAAPAAEEEVNKPLFTTIHLPEHRQLYLQLSEDPARTSLMVRLAEPRTEASLIGCDDINVFAGPGPLRMRVLSHGDHFAAGRLPLHAAELLASTADAVISVCGVQWQLGQESREAIQGFLNERRDLLEISGDSDAPAEGEPASPSAPPPPAPAATAPGAPRSAPSAPPSAPGAPPSAPGAPTAPTPPTGTFAAMPSSAAPSKR